VLPAQNNIRDISSYILHNSVTFATLKEFEIQYNMTESRGYLIFICRLVELTDGEESLTAFYIHVYFRCMLRIIMLYYHNTNNAHKTNKTNKLRGP
jgi:hypothetical protein